MSKELKAGDYQPSAAVAALLANHGVQLYPPNSKAGIHDVTWEGKKFILPGEPVPMTFEAAALALIEKGAEENTLVDVSEIVDALPFDGAQAFQLAIEELFGFGLMKQGEVMGMFGKMKVPPVLRSIRTGPGQEDYIQVIWGGIAIPALRANGSDSDVILQCGVSKQDGRLVFCVEGQIPRGKKHILNTLMALTRIYAEERSIYKGKAVRMFVGEDGRLDLNKEPEFIAPDLSKVSELVFSKETREQIETSLFAPIMYPDACRAMGMPLKRGVLLEGKYGVGKSMTAAATAALAVQAGWTFILLDRVSGLKQILDFAHRYAPVVIFSEDIDRVISGEDRTVKIDDILNSLDGVQGKNREILTVFSTNHVENMNRAILRPGRIDAIVNIGLPDADAAEILARQYGRGFIKSDMPLTRAKDILANRIPAAIREAVERAKLAAIFREKGVAKSISDNDLVIAARSMDAQMELLNTTKDNVKSPAQRLGEAMADIVGDQLKNDTVDQIDTNVVQIKSAIGA